MALGKIVQQAMGGGLSQTVGFSLPYPTTLGNVTLVIAGSTTHGKTLAGTVSDIAGNTYTNVMTASENDNQMYAWVCYNAYVVNSSYSVPAFFYDTSGSGQANVEFILGYEITVCTATDQFNSIGVGGGSGTINITTGQAHELIYAAFMGGGSMPSGFTALQSQQNASGVVMQDCWKQDAGAAGSNSMSFGTGVYCAMAMSMHIP